MPWDIDMTKQHITNIFNPFVGYDVHAYSIVAFIFLSPLIAIYHHIGFRMLNYLCPYNASKSLKNPNLFHQYP